MVFDLPMNPKSYLDRYIQLKEILGTNEQHNDNDNDNIKTAFKTDYKYIYLVKQYRLESETQLQQFYTKVIQKNGEGVVIKDQNSKYIKKRTKKRTSQKEKQIRQKDIFHRAFKPLW